VEPVERFVAPPDFHMMMLDMLQHRIAYGHKVCGIDAEYMHIDSGAGAMPVDRAGMPIISTMPMPVMIKAVGIDAGFGSLDYFSHKPIYTERWHIENCDVHQTIYFPESSTPLYRATLTGGDLILECISPSSAAPLGTIDLACKAFGIDVWDCTLIKSGEQKYGKIAPIDDAARKMFMFNLTQKLGVYSLGRFACWRNILLDDVYEDIFKIRRMLNQGAYDVRKEL